VLDFATELKQMTYISRALSYYSHIGPKLWVIPCEWNYDLKTSAGRFSARRGITLHPGLKKADPAHMVETFMHELAHAMQYLAHGKVNHGHSWHEMMYLLAQRPERLHNIAECRGSASEFDGIELF
ncbi:MAG TPA: SprT-like domain-containing protein, partial [Anaerolineales bacterium]|nr:SprT-like domain-containing protein [Anaerolineales bacterium]